MKMKKSVIICPRCVLARTAGRKRENVEGYYNVEKRKAERNKGSNPLLIIITEPSMNCILITQEANCHLFLEYRVVRITKKLILER